MATSYILNHQNEKRYSNNHKYLRMQKAQNLFEFFSFISAIISLRWLLMDNKGWGLGTMIALMGLIFFFGLVALYYIFRMHDWGLIWKKW